MIIPIKCFNCGKVMADKYLIYKKLVLERKMELLKDKDKREDLEKVVYFTEKNIEKTIEGQILDQLNIVKPCCRCLYLTHVDIE
jgi:DNA-directed RNA polymerase I, II, and III subunit RPABC5